MGIKGLTTYVEKHADKFFENYQLNDCYLVIDGNSLASQLYSSVCKSNSAFGGDYDSYADCVRRFFNILRKCNVTPLILLDGGYEVKKLKTVRSRFLTRICDARKINPVVQMKRSIFPLFLTEAFKEVVFEMGIKFVQCAFEADHEIAAVARGLNCPVLSYDSDFYIYDVMYIPFDKLSLETVETEQMCGSAKNSYAIECKVYKVENFLSSFGSIERTALPLIATVLGNDYIEKKVFQNFFSKIKHPRSRTSSDTQRHIAGLLTWLRGKTLDGAVSMILACIKQSDRQMVLEQLNKSMHSYSRSSALLPRLCPDMVSLPVEATDKLTAEAAMFHSLPLWLTDSFNKGLLPASVMNMLSLRLYFCKPQVEDYALPHSHEFSLTILPVIFGLLTAQGNETSGLTVIFRSKNAQMHRVVVKPAESAGCLKPFPCLEDLPNVPRKTRASVIFELAGLDEKCRLLLETVPEAWKLFIIATVFWAQRSVHLHVSLPSLICAMLLTAIALKVVDSIVGYFRTRKHFLTKHGSKVKKLRRSEKSKQVLVDTQSNDLCCSSVNDIRSQDREPSDCSSVKNVQSQNRDPSDCSSVNDIRSQDPDPSDCSSVNDVRSQDREPSDCSSVNNVQSQNRDPSDCSSVKNVQSQDREPSDCSSVNNVQSQNREPSDCSSVNNVQSQDREPSDCSSVNDVRSQDREPSDCSSVNNVQSQDPDPSDCSSVNDVRSQDREPSDCSSVNNVQSQNRDPSDCSSVKNVQSQDREPSDCSSVNNVQSQNREPSDCSSVNNVQSQDREPSDCSSVNNVQSQDPDPIENITHSYHDTNTTVSDAFKRVTEPDCFLFVETFVPFRYLDESLKCNPKLYNVTVVHALAQFQSCLLHLMCLNAVLNFPFEQTAITSFFSGSAIYNLYANFKSQANVNLHILQLFGNSPSILSFFFSLQKVIAALVPCQFIESRRLKKNKKKSVKKKTVKLKDCRQETDQLEGEAVSEGNVFLDENNKFSVLSCI